MNFNENFALHKQFLLSNFELLNFEILGKFEMSFSITCFKIIILSKILCVPSTTSLSQKKECFIFRPYTKQEFNGFVFPRPIVFIILNKPNTKLHHAMIKKTPASDFPV